MQFKKHNATKANFYHMLRSKNLLQAMAKHLTAFG